MPCTGIPSVVVFEPGDPADSVDQGGPMVRPGTPHEGTVDIEQNQGPMHLRDSTLRQFINIPSAATMVL